jgi:predicted negative regulator of RcsB-dependent stress response
VAKVKKTRKELLKEPDEFITTTGKLIQWAVKHQSQLTYALLAVVVIALGISTYRFFSVRSENRAALLLQQAVAKYDELKKDRPPAEAYAAVSSDFALIIDDYGNKQNGKIAGLRFANICYEAGEVEKSVALFEKALSDFEAYPLIRNQILISLAMAHLRLGEDSAAIGHFEQIVNGSLDANKAVALFHLGDLYARAGQEDKSRAAYKRLLDDFAESTYSELVPKAASG